ncbi:helix-turn-helix domain-containing protein [Gordonia sp. zg691]|uniref:Helix-turn-helix domain-containing protein n=1 Tax=Gordonia jinghuaiqii TaxID=2758710 RepID=A0A7D7LPA0_9ACTN|nr:helix-turn-helix transcriptional regulator [Gordonia jinghuaiqii]MBD0862537.1 helix-turn-helix domain-containing protein [Gordonia jinghuaiqii]MCR5976638.1 helix-turn-helix domain-containing protein [Gordonia jinghuaiqii]QMS99822.1 helix-turn-helix domain-containing protein [Gordonia jinghuaiqii]
MDRDALAGFLKNRRDSLQPSDVGVVTGPRRRTAGLRREEVAQLAAMSTDYYTRLEQRRGPQPSTQMLAALTRALRLTPDERDYMYRVAGHSAPDRIVGSDYIAPGLMRVLDRLTDTPALIISALGETLVQNDSARALFGDVSHLTGFERSAIYRWFARPDQERWRYPPDDHDRQSRAQVASLRAAYGAMGADSRAGALVGELSRLSSEFGHLWRTQVVSRRFEDHKTLIHPELGSIEVDCQALFTEDASQVLLVLTAAPRTDAAGKIELLNVLGTQRMESAGR